MSRVIIPEKKVKSPRACEEALIAVIGMLVRAGVVSFSALEAIPGLQNELCVCLYEWAHAVAFPRFYWVAREIGVTWEDLASEWYLYAMRLGESAEDDPAHPSMDRFLSMARISGPRSAVAYMMTAAGNFVRSARRNYWNRRLSKEERKEREEKRKRLKENPAEKELGWVEVLQPGQKPGVNPNLPWEAFTTGGYEALEIQQAMDELFIGIGTESFLDVTAVLSRALKMKREAVADRIFLGDHLALAVNIVAEIGWRLRENVDAKFERYLADAREFVLPPHMRADRDVLLRALYRATSKEKRAAFAGGNPFERQ